MNREENSRFSALAYSRRINARAKEAAVPVPAPFDSQRVEAGTEFEAIVTDIRNELVSSRGKSEAEKRLYNETLNKAILGFEEERAVILAIVKDIVAKKRIRDIPLPQGNYESLSEAVFSEVIGLNVLELVLKDRDDLEEIQVVGKHIYEVRSGTVRPAAYRFSGVKEVERIQQNLVLFNNDTLSPRKRWAEVMLHDGSRVTMTGFGFTSEPTLTIRFYTVKRFDLVQLCALEYETIDREIRSILLCLIRSCFNMVVIGPTNSGKTNLIKALIAEMPNNERLITIESRYELMLRRDFPEKNVIEYEVGDDEGQHSGQQAFKLALRQSPKRIIHAEIRDEDANVYVRACTRGHEGSLTTVHANELEDVPDAITDMCMSDRRGMDPERLRKRITRYVTQIGIEMAIVGGKRKVVRIGEYEYRGQEVHIRDIVRYDNLEGRWRLLERLSASAAKRINKYDPDGYDTLQSLGVIDAVDADQGEFKR